jgi:hypothetical protein
MVRLDAITSLIRMRVFNEASELDDVRPVIMTQKQYQDALDYQRKYLLRELTDLHDILEWRAREITPEDISNQEPKDSEDYLGWLRTDYPDLWSQAVSEVLAVLKAGKLRPVSIPEEGKKSLISYGRRSKSFRQSYLSTRYREKNISGCLWREKTLCQTWLCLISSRLWTLRRKASYRISTGLAGRAGARRARLS